MPNKARSSKFLVGHTKSILGFYEPVVFDSRGGFFQNFLDDGSVFDPVSNTMNTYLPTRVEPYSRNRN